MALSRIPSKFSNNGKPNEYGNSPTASGGTVVVEASLGVGFPLKSPAVRPAEEASDDDNPFVVDVVATNNKAAVAVEQHNLIYIDSQVFGSQQKVNE